MPITGTNINFVKNSTNTVNITPLKSKALTFPEPVRSLILSEPDSMDAAAFIEKLGTYEKLLKIGVDLK